VIATFMSRTPSGAFRACPRPLPPRLPAPPCWTARSSNLDEGGRPQFYELMRRRGPQHFAAFDVLWLNGRDLRAHDVDLCRRPLRVWPIRRPQVP
jgi:hypothetical protein